MPRTRESNKTPIVPVRESPRKRKRTVDVEETANALLIKPSKEATSVSPNSARSKLAKPSSGNTREKSGIASPIVPQAGIVSTAKNSKKSTQVLNHGSEAELDISRKAKRTSQRAPTKANTEAQITVDKISDTAIATLEEQVHVRDTHVEATEGGNDKPEKLSRKRKTKGEKEAENMPLAVRSQGLKMFVGAHVSIAKGVENAVTNSIHIGGNAFALFLKSQRKWENPALKAENRDAFKQACGHHHYDSSSHVVPHGSYLVNLASADNEMAKKSYDAFVDDLHRCEALNIKYYNFHPGSTNGKPLGEAIERLANNLNRALAETKMVVPLLENMAGHGSIIGSRFSDLRDIIAGIKPEYKSRIGVCIDTCHTFAAGYDLRSPDAFGKTFQELDDTVGLQYLKAMHINDSKAPLDSHRDLHQNIGKGFLGLRAFHNVMNDARLQDIPLILETPCEKPDPKDPKKTIDDKTVWAREIKLLESLIGMDAESKEFVQLEADLSEQGRAEREKMQQSVDAKEEKARKKAAKEAAKGQKHIGSMFGSKGKNKKRKSSTDGSSELSDMESET